MHWVAHLLGLDTQHSYFYNFWSGVATQASLIVAALSYWRRNTCHVRWCWRIGHHRLDDSHWVLCRRHHPHLDDRAPSAEDITAEREGRR